MLDREQVLHVARLARLELTDEEVERMAKELSHVLDHIEKIRELDLDGVPPTSHVVDVVNALRADEPEPSLPREVILAAAPEPLEDGFGVPSPGAAVTMGELIELTAARRGGAGARRRDRRPASCSTPIASAPPPTS